MSLRLRPGSLWPAVDARTRSALACGALQPITTRREWVEEGGVRFLVHVLGGESRKQSHAAAQRREGIDPFATPEPELFVADVSDTHYCVLNKFPILPRHALVVTRAFEEQEAYLGEADFEALSACLAEGPAFVAYNSGPGAGASQRHKHLQLVPAPLGEGPALLFVARTVPPGLRVQTVLLRARLELSPQAVPGLLPWPLSIYLAPR